MYRVLVNDQPDPGENAWKTWGDLLRGLEERCAAQGRVVTAVRFDGVEQPAFREGTLASYGLGALATIEVEAVQPEELIASTVDHTLDAIDTLSRTAERLGGQFRGFDVSSANEELGQLAQSLGNMVTIAGTVSQAIGVNLGTLTCNGEPASAMVDQLLNHADALISAQGIGDWITVADIVEYDIAPSLRHWPALFQALRAAVPAAAAPVV
jgi:hypothetical protein